MSWKPGRGNRVLLDRNIANSYKYMQLTQDHFNKVTFADLKLASKYLYSWFMAEKYLRGAKFTFDQMPIHSLHMAMMQRNKQILYKRLQPLLPTN